MSKVSDTDEREVLDNTRIVLTKDELTSGWPHDQLPDWRGPWFTQEAVEEIIAHRTASLEPSELVRRLRSLVMPRSRFSPCWGDCGHPECELARQVLDVLGTPPPSG